jgi:uncharacterized protein (DUF1800 family)
MKKLYFLFFTILFYSNNYAQDDYFGAGNDQNVTVTSSSDDGTSESTKTVDGSGLNAKEFEAARFLAQATLGYTHDEILDLAATDNDFATWIDDQIAITPRLHLPLLDSIYAEALALYVSQGGSPDDYYGPWALHYNYTFWQSLMTGSDHLRQAVAMALSEIFVISMESDLRDFGEGLASYYDIFVDNAFGNYRDILEEVTLHPCMGFYLSHLNNRKTNGTVHPDENYAREIMQLFSIGIYKLNMDGSIVTSGGDPVPTYDNDDITELAKVFTGLYGGADVNGGGNVDFGDGIYSISRKVPMQMYGSQHEPGSKTILDDYVIPGGQSGMDDIEDALDHIFNHQNVGPFMALRLIQRFVKSNPTPQYIQRVAQKFNNNGSGVRGDMGAVIKAILLDDEARDCAWMNDGSAGKMRSPILRYTQFAKAVGHDSPEGRYWNHSFAYLNNADQIPLSAPSVFNFYIPDYAPNGPITDAGMVAPEFQIFTTRTSIGYINRVNRWAVWLGLMYSWEDGDPDVDTDLTELENYADYPEVLLNHVDLLFTVGQLTDETRSTLRDALTPFGGGNQNYNRARMAAYLIMISPDYIILK